MEVSANLEEPVLINLLSSKPRPIELGVNFALALVLRWEGCPTNKLKAHKGLAAGALKSLLRREVRIAAAR